MIVRELGSSSSSEESRVLACAIFFWIFFGRNSFDRDVGQFAAKWLAFLAMLTEAAGYWCNAWQPTLGQFQVLLAFKNGEFLQDTYLPTCTSDQRRGTSSKIPEGRILTEAAGYWCNAWQPTLGQFQVLLAFKNGEFCKKPTCRKGVSRHVRSLDNARLHNENSSSPRYVCIFSRLHSWPETWC